MMHDKNQQPNHNDLQGNEMHKNQGNEEQNQGNEQHEQNKQNKN